MANKQPTAHKITAVIAFGANLNIPKGDIGIIFHSLIEKMGRHHIAIESHSSIYRTPAYPAGSGSDFINAVFLVKTDLSPIEILETLHKVEDEFGRKRPYRWSPRSCDLDLLFYDNLVLPNQTIWQNWANLDTKSAQEQTPDQLILPHPRLHERAFVLTPLMDITPDFYHPTLKKTIRELWERLPVLDKAKIQKI